MENDTRARRSKFYPRYKSAFSPGHLTSKRRPYGRLPAEATSRRQLKSLSMVNGIPVEGGRMEVQRRAVLRLAARCAQLAAATRQVTVDGA